MSLPDKMVAAVTPAESERARQEARAKARAAAGTADWLAHIRGAVAHHMYEEEGDRFLDLKRLSARDHEHLTERFREEFERYMRGDGGIIGPENTVAGTANPARQAAGQQL